MYIDTSSTKINGKTYTRHLLRENYREAGKVKHRTIANLSKCSAEEISAIRLALTHKGDLSRLTVSANSSRSTKHAKGSIDKGGAILPASTPMPDVGLPEMRQGKSIGAVWLLSEVARELGIAAALGDGRQGRLALWQVLARVIGQGSRLSAVRLAAQHCCGTIGLDALNENALYANLDWLEAQQAALELSLFKHPSSQADDGLYLYDVTSSYLEGEHNELAAFGYNRDGKKGKRQIVIGLLCNSAGVPLAIEVFAGNTQDPKTVDSQIKKLANRFGAKSLTLVGDRGMLKSEQTKDIGEHQWNYITAITKPQIEKLLKTGVVQLGLFDEPLAEVTDKETRYVLRRNPVRQEEMALTHASKSQRLQAVIDKENLYLLEHKKASATLALKRVQTQLKRLALPWIALSLQERTLHMVEDATLKAEHTKLDGCYVIKTNLTQSQADKETVHQRYKDLAQVEWAFRTAKSVLEMRPIYVRLAAHTRAHALVVMLAYRIIQELSKRWRALEITVAEGIAQLTTLCVHDLCVDGVTLTRCVPTPNEQVLALFEHAKVRLPTAPSAKEPKVSTKRKLTSRRN
jgi:transposase